MSPSAMPRRAASVGWMRSDLAAGDFPGLAVVAEIELAVQPRRRLVGDQRQRVARASARRSAAARPDGPGNRHSRSPRWSSNRSRSCRSASAACCCRDRCGRRAASRRHRVRTAAPVRRAARTPRSRARRNRRRRARARRLVEMGQPLPAVASFGEGLVRRRAAATARQKYRNRRALRRPDRPPCAWRPASDRSPRRRYRRAPASWSRAARYRRMSPSPSRRYRARRWCAARERRRSRLRSW